jgi:hypothetical protein
MKLNILFKPVFKLWIFMTFLLIMGGCAANHQIVKKMEVTGYCKCGKCCSWERGSWKYLKLNFWNRYVSAGSRKGRPYSGLTASGTKPHTPHPGLFSMDSLKKPWMIPIRIIFFPWLFLPRDGTLAADTRYYPFGTRMYIPGYGYGRVEDRGGAIKGSRRLDAFFSSHRKALKWGRQRLSVKIEK